MYRLNWSRDLRGDGTRIQSPLFAKESPISRSGQLNAVNDGDEPIDLESSP